MNVGKALASVIVGLTAGALIGMLFAPGKGSDIRMQLSEKEEGFEEALIDKFDEFLNSLSEKFENAKDVVSDFAEQAQIRLDKMKKNDKNVMA